MWRLQIIFPVVCASIAVAFGAAGRRERALMFAVGAVAISLAFLPMRVQTATGQVALDKMIFSNPSVEQEYRLFNPFRGRPFELIIPAGQRMSHALWLDPGRYTVAVDAEGDVGLTIDGDNIDVQTTKRGSLYLAVGYWHDLQLSSSEGTRLRRLWIHRAE